MKLVELKCKNCGSILKVDENAKSVTCEYCQTTFSIDDEVQHVEYDNMEKSGYEFEKGRIKARKEEEEKKEQEKARLIREQEEAERKRKNLKWWILGWIFFFPIPLTIIIWKSKWPDSKKLIAIVLLWGIILMVGAHTASDNNTQDINTQDTSNSIEAEQTIGEINVNEKFIEKYNSISTSKIENTITYNAQDKESGYYRVEFRLGAFDNNTSLHGSIGSNSVDLINYGYFDEKDELRFYASVENEDEMKIIFKNAINILDSNISDEAIDKAIDDAIRMRDERLSLDGNIKNGYIIFMRDKWEILIDSNVDFAKH